MKTSRRGFIGGLLATGIGTILFGTTIEKAEALGTCPPNLIRIDGEFHDTDLCWGSSDCEGYRLVFNQTQSVPGRGEWVHQHNGVNLLWVSSSGDGWKPVLGWHRKPDPIVLLEREAIDIIQGELNRTRWIENLTQVSFTIPRWAMEALCILPL